MKNKRILIVLFIILLLFSLSGCGMVTHIVDKAGDVNSDDLIIESKSIKPDELESVDVEIKMGAGELDISGGSDNLVDAKFMYSIEKLKPIIDYDKHGNKGNLKILTPRYEGSFSSIKGYKYKWNLSLNNEIPLDIEIDLGAGASDINLKDIKLKDVDINVGAGETKVDISGDYSKDVDVDISGGVGETTVYLPKELGVCVYTQKGIGDINADGFIVNGDKYTNDNYKKCDVNINVKIESGIGEINLKLK